jgi:hypothetical protein
MNERNVAALTEMLRIGCTYQRGPANTVHESLSPPMARRFAEALASRGVLVPSTLTDEDVADTLGLGHMDGNIREALARIAKGEV